MNKKIKLAFALLLAGTSLGALAQCNVGQSDSSMGYISMNRVVVEGTENTDAPVVYFGNFGRADEEGNYALHSYGVSIDTECTAYDGSYNAATGELVLFTNAPKGDFGERSLDVIELSPFIDVDGQPRYHINVVSSETLPLRRHVKPISEFNLIKMVAHEKRLAHLNKIYEVISQRLLSENQNDL